MAGKMAATIFAIRQIFSFPITMHKRRTFSRKAKYPAPNYFNREHLHNNHTSENTLKLLGYCTINEYGMLCA